MMFSRKYVAGTVLALTVMACAVPGVSQPSAPPTFDLNTIPTLVFLTANALASPTVVAATPPVETVAAESITATPQISLAGSSLLMRDDKTTVFSDYWTGTTLIVPAGWRAVRINEQEYFDAWVLPEFADPAFQSALSRIKNLDPKELRLFAFDVQAGHLQGGFVTNINWLWTENDTISLDNDNDLQDTADSIAKSMPGMVVLAKDIVTTANGIPLGVITSKRSGTTTSGAEVVVFYKQIFLNAQTGVLSITLTTSEELRDAVLPAFDAMLETIKKVEN